jgi:hypothetical protein
VARESGKQAVYAQIDMDQLKAYAYALEPEQPTVTKPEEPH